MIAYLKLNAPNDTNGNPRRGWLVWSVAGATPGRTLAFVEEGYEGDGLIRREYPRGVDLGGVNVSAGEYRSHVKAKYGIRTY